MVLGAELKVPKGFLYLQFESQEILSIYILDCTM